MSNFKIKNKQIEMQIIGRCLFNLNYTSFTRGCDTAALNQIIFWNYHFQHTHFWEWDAPAKNAKLHRVFFLPEPEPNNSREWPCVCEYTGNVNHQMKVVKKKKHKHSVHALTQVRTNKQFKFFGESTKYKINAGK